MLNFSVDSCLSSFQTWGSGGTKESMEHMVLTSVTPYIDVLYLPAPIFGSSVEMQGKNPISRIRDGTPIVSNVMGKENYKFNYTVIGLHERIAEELYDFSRGVLGLEFTLLDWRSDSWTVILTQPTQIVQNGIDNFSAVLEMEGI